MNTIQSQKPVASPMQWVQLLLTVAIGIMIPMFANYFKTVQDNQRLALEKEIRDAYILRTEYDKAQDLNVLNQTRAWDKIVELKAGIDHITQKVETIEQHLIDLAKKHD